jgi:hypothetical protein
MIYTPITILFHPKKAIQKVMQEDHHYGVWMLSFFYGLGMTFYLLKTFFISNFIFNLWVSIVLGFFVGNILFSLFAYLINNIGKLFYHASSYYPIRTCIAWSSLPLIIMNLFGIVFDIVKQTDFWVTSIDSTFFIWSLFITKLVLMLWAFFILIETLMEVMKLSFLKVFSLFVISSVFYLISIFVLIWALGLIFV